MQFPILNNINPQADLFTQQTEHLSYLHALIVQDDFRREMIPTLNVLIMHLLSHPAPDKELNTYISRLYTLKFMLELAINEYQLTQSA